MRWRETQIAGVRTNAAFLIRCLRHPDFLAGDIDTGFIERHRDALLPPPPAPRPEIFAAAAQFRHGRARARRTVPIPGTRRTASVFPARPVK